MKASSKASRLEELDGRTYQHYHTPDTNYRAAYG